MGTIPTYKLRGLPPDECMRLFIKCAFGKGEVKKHDNLMKIGLQIVAKCGGVPLALTTLGSLLYSSLDEHDWKNVRDSEIWKLEQTKGDILPALRLSYDHLLPYLKQCFVYCSFFPKDYKFDNFELIQFWMANGLLDSPRENQDLENVGMQYLKELQSRSFFQDFEIQLGSLYGFKMHDLIHDLAISLMKSEYLMLKSSNQRFSQTIRHLSFVDSDVRKTDLPSFLSNLGHLRSINCFEIEEDEARESLLESCISRFQFLRVLNLSDAGITALPNRIGNLKHLRYLKVRDNKEIKELPSSIWKLQSLQTLVLGGCTELKEIPRDIRYLISLRHFSLTTKQRLLPKNGIGCLNSLRYIGISNCVQLEYLFEDIGRLKVLQTLAIVGCPNLVSLPCGIKYLCSLECLILSECEKLNLDLSIGTEGEGNNQYLNIPRLHLRFLVIAELPKMVKLPEWLVKVSGNTLQTLYIGDCSNFKALPESMQDFKSLEQLCIGNCPQLSSLPKGMNCLTAMRELEIQDCPSLSEKCKLETDDNWSTIAHIPKILLDGEIIKSTKN